MGTLGVTAALWGFYRYVINNPHKPIGGMTNTDFYNMLIDYIGANSEASTTESLTDADWPTKAASTVAASDSAATYDQVSWPETMNAGA